MGDVSVTSSERDDGRIRPIAIGLKLIANFRLSHIRYLREITWPRMTLRYTLTQNGSTLAQGEETISDMSYLMDASARVSSDDLRYEKTMLSDWFRNRIVRALP